MRRFHALASLILLLPNARAQEDLRKAPDSKSAKHLQLPGAQVEGTILLHNQWSLKPAGKQLDLGDFPVNSALHPSGQWLAVLHAGYGVHEIVVVDLTRNRHKVYSRVDIDQSFYGLCFSPDGRRLFASGGELEVVHAFDFAEGLLSRRRRIAVAKWTETFIPAGLAV